ncbi:AlpA family transcriptional regulator [Photobacterium sp. TLY01]|uniref:helix-turn-helix transcriptional regulator n=1 Tax=Photobacterium sp. TLY01 TaxID=2907534 RepID=UPI001F19002F|nr:AlpA family phage regulatory protein [Photobacterium sp. TLY01]UIP27772.1 AlpA family transcriptional regulator [Photobacterium sp. TLY01]
MTQLDTNQPNLSSKEILLHYGETERLCREKERRRITSLSRSQAWVLEQEGKFPTRKKIGRTNVWLLSELLLWTHQLRESNSDA